MSPTGSASARIPMSSSRVIAMIKSLGDFDVHARPLSASARWTLRTRQGRPPTVRQSRLLRVGLHDFDGASWARGPGESPVAGEQWRLECLGEGDIGGVVDRQVVAQLPTAGQQWRVFNTLDGQV